MFSQGLRRIAVALAAIASLGAASSAEAQAYDGDWQGALKTPQGQLRLVLHLKTEKGETLAKLDIPDQGATLSSGAVKYEDGKINILFWDAMAEVKGSLSPDGKTLNARWAQGLELPFTMTRIEVSTPAAPTKP